jgi:hypothetical protein
MNKVRKIDSTATPTHARATHGPATAGVDYDTAVGKGFSCNPDGTVRVMCDLSSAQTISGVKTFSGQPTTTVNVGTKNGSTVSVVERGVGILHQTVFTLTDLAIVQLDNGANASGGVEIYTFPKGYIKHLGTVVNLALTTDAGASADFAGGLGSVTAAADGTLASTEQNFIPSTALSATASAATFAALSTATEEVGFDGTSTPKGLYLNFADTHDVGGLAVHVHCTGTITVNWLYLGDK